MDNLLSSIDSTQKQTKLMRAKAARAGGRFLATKKLELSNDEVKELQAVEISSASDTCPVKVEAVSSTSNTSPPQETSLGRKINKQSTIIMNMDGSSGSEMEFDMNYRRSKPKIQQKTFSEASNDNSFGSQVTFGGLSLARSRDRGISLDDSGL